MTRFITTIPNLSKDPNGTIMRTAEYHLDPGGIGHRLITRDGTCFALTEHSTPASEKAFLSTMPPCKGTSARDIRSWYHRFTAHAAQHRVYVHPYYCFRPYSGSSNGFNIGTDTDTVTYDLPDKHHINIPMWNSQIYTAISKDSIFPKDSAAKDTVLDHYGEGYAAVIEDSVFRSAILRENRVFADGSVDLRVPHGNIDVMLVWKVVCYSVGVDANTKSVGRSGMGTEAVVWMNIHAMLCCMCRKSMVP